VIIREVDLFSNRLRIQELMCYKLIKGRTYELVGTLIKKKKSDFDKVPFKMSAAKQYIKYVTCVVLS